MIQIDNKKAEIREKKKHEDSENEINLPEGHALVSLADCIRNIKATEKEKILKDYLSLVNSAYKERYKEYRESLAKYYEEKKRKKDEEYEKIVNSQINEEKAEEKVDEGEVKNLDSILITQTNNLTNSEKNIFQLSDLVDQAKNKKNKPLKPPYIVFSKLEILVKKLNDAINVVKQEKKWIVLDHN